MTPTRTDVLKKVLVQLTHPRKLASFIRYKLRDGNEYLYYDLADMLPAVAGAAARCAPQRVDLARPLFLASLRRSGSTLFYRIMNANRDLFLFNERFPGDRMNGRGEATAANIWSVEDPDLFRKIVYRHVGPHIRRRNRFWGVKLAMEPAHPNPGSLTVEGLAKVFRFLPGARVIGLVRDPRDFVLSALARAGHDVAWWIDEYRVMMDMFEQARSEHPDRFTTIRYEQILQDPEATIRACCSFAGLEFDETMLLPSSWSHKGPRVYASNRIVPQSEKWRKAEGPDAAIVRQVEAACFPAALRFGYLPASS